MSSVCDAGISTTDSDQQKQQQQHGPPKPPRVQHRVSFAVTSNHDHPLLVIRKRMKAGDTRHAPSSLRTYGKSVSVLMDDPEGKERLRRILERVQNDDTPTHLLTPRGEDGITMSPPRTPPTPGRCHDITWDQEAPMFFPLQLAAAPSPSPVSSVDSDDLVAPFNNDVSSSPSSLHSLPSVNIKPRFECPWILEKLGMPELSDGKEEGFDHELPIPFAPFTDNEDDQDEGHVDKKTKSTPKLAPPSLKANSGTSSSVASASAKLAGLSVSVSAAAERSNINRRRSVNARTA